MCWGTKTVVEMLIGMLRKKIAELGVPTCGDDGYIPEKKGDVEYVMWRRVDGYLAQLGFPNKLGKDAYIPENIFYRLAMKAKNETAEPLFRRVRPDARNDHHQRIRPKE